MRIIPDEIKPFTVNTNTNGGLYSNLIYEHDTIEITDAQICEIERGWHRESYKLGTYDYPFSQYLKELIRLKGANDNNT